MQLKIKTNAFKNKKKIDVYKYISLVGSTNGVISHRRAFLNNPALLLMLSSFSFLIGWFFDWTQSYDLAFYFSGTCVLVSGLFLFLATLPCWNRTTEEGDSPPEKDVNISQQNHTLDCDKVASVA